MTDFTKDGILHCGECKQPKEKIIQFGDKTLRPRILCKCELEEKQRREEQEKEWARLDRIDRLREYCFDDKELKGCTFDNADDSEVIKVAKNYAEKFEELNNTGLLLYGSVGTGKTYSACCIANALLDKGYSCYVTTFPKIVNKIQSTFDKQEYIDHLVSFDLLIIDDLASERNTEYMNEIVTNVIDSRYRTNKPIVITTNLTADEMKNPTDIAQQRIQSRIMEMCYPFEVKGTDRRRNARKTITEKYKGVLENG